METLKAEVVTSAARMEALETQARTRLESADKAREAGKLQGQADMRAAADQLEAMQRKLVGMERWHPPDQVDAVREELRKAAQGLKAAKEELKGLKDDLSRKNVLLAMLKADKEKADAALTDLRADKEVLDTKWKRAMQEAKARDAHLKLLKDRVEHSEGGDASASAEAAKLRDKVKSLLAEAARRETQAKETKAKLEKASKESEAAQEKDEALAVARESVKRVKGEAERAGAAAKAAKSKVEGLSEEVARLQAAGHAGEAREAKSSKAHAGRLEALEARLETAQGAASAAHEAAKRAALLERAFHGVGAQLLSQVESLVARLPQRHAGGGSGARGGGAGRDGGAGSARRMRDGQRILDMALEAPSDAMQLQHALLRFVDERVGLEVVVAQAAGGGDHSGHSGGAGGWAAGSAGSAGSGGSGPRWAWQEPSRVAGRTDEDAESNAPDADGGKEAPGGREAAGEGWGGRRAAVQAQVDDIQQRLGLFVSAARRGADAP
ncbi:hypothetical protein T484DRAFT_1929440, partial [Baffinella frigidus]